MRGFDPAATWKRYFERLIKIDPPNFSYPRKLPAKFEFKKFNINNLMKQEIIITRGLPGSGKTTWALKYIEDNPGKYKRINRDTLRAMMDDGKWSPQNEKFVRSVRDTVINMALDSGFSVIVDDTNLADSVVNQMCEIALNRDIGFSEQCFTDVPLATCIERDAARENPVGENVIRNMYHQHLGLLHKPREQDQSLPAAYVFDLDGTLALNKSGRSYYDMSRVGEDTVNEDVVRVLRHLSRGGAIIIILSGRSEDARNATLDWLRDADINTYISDLRMRREGDKRKDAIIKKEIMLNDILPSYNVVGVFDDRLQVCEMWHDDLGLTVFRVGDPKADF